MVFCFLFFNYIYCSSPISLRYRLLISGGKKRLQQDMCFLWLGAVLFLSSGTMCDVGCEKGRRKESETETERGRYVLGSIFVESLNVHLLEMI